MLDQQINEQLGLLQKELERLKSVTDYIDSAKENSLSIVNELERVQQNYTTYTDKIFALYKQHALDIKQHAEVQINDGVLKFETTGNKIDNTNKEKLVEIKRLLEQYRKIVEATDNLVKTLESVDFPTRLSTIDNNINALKLVLNENQNVLVQKLDNQAKEIKTLKTISFIICGLIVLGTVAIILFK